MVGTYGGWAVNSLRFYAELKKLKEQTMEQADNINHPSHYNAGKIEVIEFIEDQGLGEGFCLGNTIKYIARAGKKDKDKTLEDLKKAAWYLARQIELLSAKQEDRSPVRPNEMFKGGGKVEVTRTQLLDLWTRYKIRALSFSVATEPRPLTDPFDDFCKELGL